MPTLTHEHQTELLNRGFSRRNFARIATVLTGGAALPFYNEHALAQSLSKLSNIPAGAVRINANENPLGPCPEAADAAYNAVKQGGRYMFEKTDALAQTLADTLNVKYSQKLEESYVQIFCGSSAPLHQTVVAFCSKDRPFVKGDPGYEAGERAAQYVSAKAVCVPLRRPAYDHDVKAMLAAAPNAGLFYICNPNNPTGTVTSRADLDYLVANKPAGSIVLIDEAYIHFSPSAVSCTDLAAAGKDVVVLRTFSKIYGLAGLRAGAAIARPDLLQKIISWSWTPLPVTGMVAATASLKVSNLVPERRKINGEIRDDAFSWLASKNVEFIPSETNCFMVNVKRPGELFTKDMAQQNIYIGRSWPVWPSWVRVTVGTRDEMTKFKTAFERCYNS